VEDAKAAYTKLNSTVSNGAAASAAEAAIAGIVAVSVQLLVLLD
jgi:hypothetical protein